MENNSYVEFKKERDLGAIITDTFKFIRENWKAYFMTILKITAPLLIITLISFIFYFYSFSGLLPALSGENEVGPNVFDSATMAISLLVLVLAGIALYVLLNMASLYFIKSYIKNNGEVVFDEIKLEIKQKFWSFFGLGILVGLMFIFGFMLCIIPGIYLWVPLSLATSIMVFEGKGISDTISHTFTLIKEQWLPTFGVLFVIGFLVGILGYVFSVPAMIYQLFKMGVMAGNDDPTAVFGLFKDPVYILLNIISYVGKYFLSSITLISTVFIYFDLNEQKNLTGTLEKIDGLGQ